MTNFETKNVEEVKDCLVDLNLWEHFCELANSSRATLIVESSNSKHCIRPRAASKLEKLGVAETHRFGGSTFLELTDLGSSAAVEFGLWD